MTVVPRQKTVLLVDGHSEVLAALTRRFESVDDFTVVGQTGSIGRALDIAARLKPAVIIADFGPSGAYAAALCARVTQATPQSMLVVYTPYVDEATRQLFADAGAVACLLKDIGFEGLLNELRRLGAVFGNGNTPGC